MKRKNTVLLFLLCVLWGVVEGAIEFCSPGRSDKVYRLTRNDCPYGVLFAVPVDTGCFQTNDADVDNFLADLCLSVPFSSNMKQIQLVSTIDDSEVPESCAGESTEASLKCNATEVVELTKNMLTPPVMSGVAWAKMALVDEIAQDAEKDSIAPEHFRKDSKILAQTKRLFKYLINLEYPSEEEIAERTKNGLTDWSAAGEKSINGTLNIPPRIVKMLQLSFLILHKHVDMKFVPKDFKLDVENAFIFLVQEAFQASGIILDVPEDDFDKIMTSLEKCLAHQVPFEVTGKNCKTFTEIDSISKGLKKIYPKQDEFSFKWQLYDLPTDGAWATLSFVHGLCYGTFREYVNYHHLYERAVEKLFNLNEITYRWRRPQKLSDERLWNKMFSTSSPQQTMKNMDGFVQAAYSGSPFLHRLERSFKRYPKYSLAKESEEERASAGATGEGSPSGPSAPADGSPAAAPANNQPAPDQSDTAIKQRKKRSNDMMYDTENPDEIPTMEDIGLKEGGWCFQTEEDQRHIIITYIFEKCRGDPIAKDFKSTLPWLFTSKESSTKDEL